MKKIVVFAVVLSLYATALAAEGPGKVMIVFDASGSMWGQVEGRAKIEIAREVLGDLLAGWDASVEVGLTAYGHRRKGDCSDIEVLLAPGAAAPGAVAAAVEKISPKGKTPLSAAVREAAHALRFEEDRATVILISDGEETCDADPVRVGEERGESDRGRLHSPTSSVSTSRRRSGRGSSAWLNAPGGSSCPLRMPVSCAPLSTVPWRKPPPLPSRSPRPRGKRRSTPRNRSRRAPTSKSLGPGRPAIATS